MVLALPATLVGNPDARIEIWAPLKKRWHPPTFTPTQKRASAVLLVALCLVATGSTAAAGLQTVQNAVLWNYNQDPYGNAPKLAALNWMAQDTKPSSIFVADEVMGRWIEGYSMRRVYMLEAPQYSFMAGQVDRYYVASTALLANYELRNAYLRVQDQSPYNPEFSPIVNFWAQGQYGEVFHVDDTQFVLSAQSGAFTLNNFTYQTSTASSQAGDEIITQYTGEGVNVTKTTTVGTGPALSLTYQVDALQPVENATVVLMLQYDLVGLVEVSGGSVTLDSTIGNIMVESNAAQIVNSPGNTEINFTFDLRRGMTMTLSVRAESPSTGPAPGTILMLSASTMIQDDGIAYLVVPRIPVAGVQTSPEYEHLLKTFGIAYLNDRVIVLDASQPIPAGT
jgi:hypothetical protein